MEFVKKNWSKLAVAVLAFICGILCIVSLINIFSVRGSDWVEINFFNPLASGPVSAATKKHYTAELINYIGLIIAFLGITALAIMKMLGVEKKTIAYVAISIGALAFILLVTGIIMNLDKLKEAKDGIKKMKAMGLEKSYNYKSAVSQYNATIFQAIFNVVIFGLAPIIYGVKKLFCNCCSAKA